MPFPFLKLSPEMRNHVYSQATESGDRKLDLLHLTQVCQQIRSEFRPMYMNEARTNMSGRELAAYLDVFHSQWAEDDVSGDKVSPLMAITRCLPWSFDERSSKIHPWDLDSVKLLAEVLPDQEVDIVGLCREKGKVALRSMNFTSFASGRIYCEVTDRYTLYYCHLAYKTDMVVKKRHVMMVQIPVLEWPGKTDILAFVKPEHGGLEERSIWVGFDLSFE